MNIVAAVKNGDDTFAHSVDRSVPIYILGSGLKAYLKLYEVLKQEQCCTICSHIFSNVFGISLLSVLSRIRVVQVLHSQYPLGKAARIKYALSYRFATFIGIKVVAVSGGVAKFAQETLRLRAVKVIYNGIDEEKFYFAIRPRQSSFVITHVGSFNEHKNHRAIIEIFRRVISLRRDVKLYLVGNGRLRPELEELVSLHNLTENVIFFGKVLDIPRVLNESHCFLLPSLREGFAKVVIEAMAMGLVPVVSDYPAAEEIIEHSKHGFIVRDQNIDDYVTHIVSLIDSEDMRYRMAKACRKRVVQAFTLKKMIDEYQKISLKPISKKR